MGKDIGTDEDGDKHFIPDKDDPTLHKVDPQCGCNPDPHHDEDYYNPKPGPANWYWVHHHLGGET